VASESSALTGRDFEKSCAKGSVEICEMAYSKPNNSVWIVSCLYSWAFERLF
jgi:hypothetical protein